MQSRKHSASSINDNYETFYARRTRMKTYPTEFVVRTLLSSYPGLHYTHPKKGDAILDIGFGDGRNTALLCDLGLNVSGIEITQGIVDQTQERLRASGCEANLQVGRNTSIPFDDNSFDYILACHCCYYCDPEETFADNMQEYTRVLKPNGFLIASVANTASFIFANAIKQQDGSFLITNDPYNNRVGYRLHGFDSPQGVEEYLQRYFYNFSIGSAENNYYGIEEKVFWVVCQCKEKK